MAASEIGVIRTLLSSKPRPQGWAERRARIDEVGSVWPVAADVELSGVDLGGISGEWSACCSSFTAAAIARARCAATAGW
jgi:monoterpene epsilon-lactone hydrolase